MFETSVPVNPLQPAGDKRSAYISEGSPAGPQTQHIQFDPSHHLRAPESVITHQTTATVNYPQQYSVTSGQSRNSTIVCRAAPSGIYKPLQAKYVAPGEQLKNGMRSTYDIAYVPTFESQLKWVEAGEKNTHIGNANRLEPMVFSNMPVYVVGSKHIQEDTTNIVNTTIVNQQHLLQQPQQEGSSVEEHHHQERGVVGMEHHSQKPSSTSSSSKSSSDELESLGGTKMSKSSKMSATHPKKKRFGCC